MTERDELIRKACLEAARRAYEDASMSGLCAEGALEAALGAIEQLDLSAIAHDNGAMEKGAGRRGR